MNKTASIILFVIIAAAVIWCGVWYSGKISQEDEQSQAAAGSQAITAQQAVQQTIMNNFKIKDDVVGTGAAVQNGDTVSVLYSGSLDDGTVFDASSLHGNQPFSFVVGATGPGSVIQGWNLGLVGMKVGGTREMTIPPELGYGAQGAGTTIPPNATLHFTVQLLSVNSSPTSTAQ
jgi:FKBP-type peptidyl-prolyl cis-trans isomerase FkpA